MSSDRPDYTGSIVIEDIELATAIFTVTGAVSVSGSVTILNPSITISGAVTVTSGNITVSGAVTVTSGSITVSGAVTITSGTVSISGTVAIAGSVTITSGTVTATISGTPNVTITGSTIDLTVGITVGFRSSIIGNNTALVGDSNEPYIGSVQPTPGVGTLTCTVTPVVPTTHFVCMAIYSTIGQTWYLYRDGVQKATGSLTASQVNSTTYTDQNVPAGTHVYSMRFSDGSSYVAIGLYVVDEFMTYYASSISGSHYGDTYMLHITSGPSNSITLAQPGTVRIIMCGCFATAGRTLSLLRDGVVQQTWADSTMWGTYTYEDADLAAGTYAYTTTMSSITFAALALFLASDGGTAISKWISPYWENLNIGLDTRAAESGGNLATIATSNDVARSTRASQATLVAPLDTDKFRTLPMAKGKTTIRSVATAANMSNTLYTVTAGKTYYFVCCALSGTGVAANLNGSVWLDCDTGGNGVFGSLCYMDVVTPAAPTTYPNAVEGVSPAVPMPFPAGTVFRVGSNNASIYAKATMIGWEE